MATSTVGRDDVLGLIDEALEQGEDERAVLCISGEAGLGKTRLAKAAAYWAHERGRMVLKGRATPVSSALPLEVFRSAVRESRRSADERPVPPDGLAASFERWLLPELGQAADVELDIVFEAACRYFSGLAAEAGLLLVLEDLHLASPSSCELVRHLAESLPESPITMLLTFREGEAGPHVNAMRHALLRERIAEERALAPLEEHAVGAMLEDILGVPPERRTLETIATMSGGNPFVVEELVRSAADEGLLIEEAGQLDPKGELTIPWTVREMLLSRLHRLPETDRDLLSWAAVAGDTFDVSIVSSAAAMPAPECAAAVSRLCDAGLLRDDDQSIGGQLVGFRHTLTRDAVLEEMIGAERVNRHRALLLAFEDRFGAEDEEHLEEMLGHALASDDRSRAFAYSAREARRTLGLGALLESEAHHERALELFDPEDGHDARAEILMGHGWVTDAAGSRESATRSFLAAREEFLAGGNEIRAATALARAADARWQMHDRAGALDDLRAALEELADARTAAGPDPGLDTAYFEVLTRHARTLVASGDPRAALEIAARAESLDTDESAFTHTLRQDLRIAVATARAHTGEIPEAVETLRDVHRTARTDGDDALAIRALLALTEVRVDQPGEAAPDADAAVRLARARRFPRLEARAVTMRAAVFVESGESERAEDQAAQAEEMDATRRDAAATVLLRTVRAMLARRRGALREATELFEGILADTESGEVWEWAWLARTGLARTALAAGEPATAQELLDPALERWSGIPGGPPRFVTALFSTATEAACHSGDALAARRHAQTVADISPGPLADYAFALVGLAEGRRPDAAPVLAAAEELEARGRHPEAARMLLTGAEAMSEARDGREGATELADRALRLYREMDAESWAHRAEGLLHRLGRRSRRRGGSDGDRLTLREGEVLGRLVAGRTNREIGEDLHITQATAARHVFNIFSKLGVHSRVEATRVALERGLVEDAMDGPDPDAEG